MFKRLLLVIAVLVGLAGCAKPPVADVEETERIVAHAYASGASRLAVEEYQSAAEALLRAEQLVKQGDYDEAQVALSQARSYSAQALGIVVQRKELYAQEQRKLAEQAARKTAEKKRAEELRLIKLEQLRKAAESKPATAVSETEVVLVERIAVAEGETLATISARPEVYADAQLWPLIYKANRDQIKNPKEIFTGQILFVPRDKTVEEFEAARQEAQELNIF